MVGEVRVGTGDCFAIRQVFGLKGLPVCGEDELGLGFGGGRADAQDLEGLAYGTDFAHSDMDVAAEQNATGHVRGVVVPCTQAFESIFLIAERGQERERKIRCLERLQGLFRYGGFNFYCIHDLPLS